MNNTDHQDLCTRRVAQVEKVLPYLAVLVLFYTVAVVSYGVYRALL
jgi:hypothetical protein